jgi:hypothetical protein
MAPGVKSADSGVKFLTQVDCRLLSALSVYRLLTIPQALRLGIAGRDHLGDRLRTLHRLGLVGMAEQGRRFGARVHWLTRRGGEAAAELSLVASPPAAPRGYLAGPHLRQRLAIVDCHLALRAWADATGARVDGFRVEFEGNPGGRLEKALRLPWGLGEVAGTYEPDALGWVTLADGSRWLFAIEVETGGERESLDNFTAKLGSRLTAFRAAAVERWANWPKDQARARLLFVFQSEDMAARARRLMALRVADYPEKLWSFVLTKSLPEVMAGFADGWKRMTSEVVSPFEAAR